MLNIYGTCYYGHEVTLLYPLYTIKSGNTVISLIIIKI